MLPVHRDSIKLSKSLRRSMTEACPKSSGGQSHPVDEISTYRKVYY